MFRDSDMSLLIHPMQIIRRKKNKNKEQEVEKTRKSSVPLSEIAVINEERREGYRWPSSAGSL